MNKLSPRTLGHNVVLLVKSISQWKSAVQHQKSSFLFSSSPFSQEMCFANIYASNIYANIHTHLQQLGFHSLSGPCFQYLALAVKVFFSFNCKYPCCNLQNALTHHSQKQYFHSGLLLQVIVLTRANKAHKYSKCNNSGKKWVYFTSKNSIIINEKITRLQTLHIFLARILCFI